jgi:hypothetical protein
MALTIGLLQLAAPSIYKPPAFQHLRPRKPTRGNKLVRLSLPAWSFFVQIIFDALIAAVVGICHCQPGINAIILVSFVVDEEAK